ncbi:hypothetical protein D3C72_2268020 [compost metagenome]
MVGAPHHTARKPWFKRHRTRAVIAAERDALQANAFGIHVATAFQPVHHPTGPMLAVETGDQIVQSQRFSCAGLIDDQ